MRVRSLRADEEVKGRYVKGEKDLLYLELKIMLGNFVDMRVGMQRLCR